MNKLLFFFLGILVNYGQVKPMDNARLSGAKIDSIFSSDVKKEFNIIFDSYYLQQYADTNGSHLILMTHNPTIKKRATFWKECLKGYHDTIKTVVHFGQFTFNLSVLELYFSVFNCKMQCIENLVGPKAILDTFFLHCIAKKQSNLHPFLVIQSNAQRVIKVYLFDVREDKLRLKRTLADCIVSKEYVPEYAIAYWTFFLSQTITTVTVLQT